jgi:uncharacterized membrane protein
MLIPEILYQISYAICHQLPDRSFFVYEEQLPLCARCTGIYLGMFIAFSFYFFTKVLKNKKHIQPPALGINILSIFFILLMAIQAVTSLYINYPLDKEMRFITGILFGFSLPWYLLITIHYSKRFKYKNEEILNYKEYLLLSLITLASATLFLLKIPSILYIIAYLSAIGLLVFIFLINLSLLILTTDLTKKLRKISLGYLIIFSIILSLIEIFSLNLLHSVIL